MMEGDWIAMPSVPLIAAGNPEVAAGVEGDGTNAPGDGTRAAEEVTVPTTDEAEHAEAAVGTVAPVLASTEAAAVPDEDTAPAPDEVAPATANAEENAGGDASEMMHAAELEAALLAASSPGREGPSEPAAAELAETPVITAEAEV
jgi:hypothetical protein